MALEFFEDAREALPVVAPLLADDPVQGTVYATTIARAAASLAAGERPARHPQWWVAVRDDASGRVVGAGMRSAPFTPYPLYLMTMPEGEARALARALVERGEPVRHANGALPAVTAYAREHARLCGGSVRIVEHIRLFELRELREPGPVPGELRVAGAADLPLVLEWFDAFTGDAAQQSGASAEHGNTPEEEVEAKVGRGLVQLWEAGGRPVCLVGRTEPQFGVVRVGPVYTPGELRGRGYASAATAAVSAQILTAGDRACLFTNQANPVSNRIYQRLGYRPVVDMANVVVDPPETPRPS